MLRNLLDLVVDLGFVLIVSVFFFILLNLNCRCHDKICQKKKYEKKKNIKTHIINMTFVQRCTCNPNLVDHKDHHNFFLLFFYSPNMFKNEEAHTPNHFQSIIYSPRMWFTIQIEVKINDQKWKWSSAKWSEREKIK